MTATSRSSPVPPRPPTSSGARSRSSRQPSAPTTASSSARPRSCSGLTAYGPGFIDADHKELEKIVGLQTDKPLKRAFMPYGGIKMARAGLPRTTAIHVNAKY